MWLENFAPGTLTYPKRVILRVKYCLAGLKARSKPEKNRRFNLLYKFDRYVAISFWKGKCP